MPRDASTPVIVLPDQLFERHPALARAPRRVILLEHRWYFFSQRFHVLKLALLHGSMLAYAEELRRAGHDVSVAGIDDGAHLRLWRELAREGVTRVELATPSDRPLLPKLRREARREGITIVALPNGDFLTDPGELGELLVPKAGRYSMARFYPLQRRRLGVLVEPDGAPVGGRWSFDADNRCRLPRDAEPPRAWRPRASAARREALRWARELFPNAPGRADDLPYPLTRREARRALDDFLEHRLPRFGAYEDAISARHDVLWHGVLTPALNIGLLHPRELLDGALSRAAEGDVPLNSLEGFVRQVIGWREFMRGVYLAEGRRLADSNELGLKADVPAAFYSATTGLPPLDATISRVLDRGWCHHIERLMILGSAMLLADVAPAAAYRWFMELFVDAYDWVMVPNVFGMSQFAAGAMMTTKPYVSGSNYLLKMSDYPRGPWCDVWDGLYWRFVERNRDMLAANPRMTVMVRAMGRADRRVLAAKRAAAEEWLRSMRV